MIRKLLTTTWILITILVTWISYSIYLSITDNDWEWFQRAGSIITLFGAILVSREVIRLGIKKRLYFFDAPDTWKPSKEKLQEQDHKREDIRAEAIGFLLILVGTAIWGYGDLFIKLISTQQDN